MRLLTVILSVLGMIIAIPQVAAAPSSQEAVVDYLDQIARRVEQQPGYPQLIAASIVKKNKRITYLRTLVKVAVTSGGYLNDVSVDLSSGDHAFDQSVLELVRQAQPFGEMPPVLVEQGRLVFILSVPIPSFTPGVVEWPGGN